MTTTKMNVMISVIAISFMDTFTNRVESYPMTHSMPSGKSFARRSISSRTFVMTVKALASFILNTPTMAAGPPLYNVCPVYFSDPISTRATSRSRICRPSAPVRTMMF